MLVLSSSELERLQEEFIAQEDFIEVVVASTFGFGEVPEDKDNMSIEILAEVNLSASHQPCVLTSPLGTWHLRPRSFLIVANKLVLNDSPRISVPVHITTQMLRNEGADNEHMIAACKVSVSVVLISCLLSPELW
jgi:hypothetical protein